MPIRDNSPLRVALRGGIGSGKSTVGDLLRDLGALVIDADQIGHEVLEPEGAAYEGVRARWPHAVVGGEIDRRRLAAVVFTDPDQLDELEALTHPHIGARIAALAEAAGRRPVVVELPILGAIVGAGWVTVIVDAPDAIRRERALARGMGEADVAARMASQPPRGAWLAAADHVIENDGTLEELAARVRELWDELHEGAAASSG